MILYTYTHKYVDMTEFLDKEQAYDRPTGYSVPWCHYKGALKPLEHHTQYVTERDEGFIMGEGREGGCLKC